MALADWFDDRPAAEPRRRTGPVQVGWFLSDPRGGIVYDPPERVRSAEVNRKHAKSASRCPAVINMESRYFLIRCPFDLHLKLVRDKNGKPGLKNMLGDASPVRSQKLNQILHVTAEREWRYADRPTIQVALPYMFIADEPVYITQLAPFMHYRRDPLPGTIFGGRFPIHLWPRPLMWAFEWHEPDRDIILRRGEPWFYCMFETEPQDRAVQVLEASLTPELKAFMDHVGGAVNMVNQTFGLFRAAGEKRPEKLFVPARG